ncbi:MAG: GNAT family N-acetyltransferase [Chloroflexi bacterium]|nr:GNAT family N-acetyltransferase [Chloroflexota bacterium]
MRDSGDFSLFQAPAWVLPWRRHLAPNVTERFVETTETVAPLVLTREHGFRMLKFAGTTLNDYNAPVARAGRAGVAAHSLMAELAEVRSAWDLLSARFPADWEVAGAFAQAARQAGLLAVRVTDEVAPAIDLSGGWDEYLRSLEGRHRKAFRYYERRLGRAGHGRFDVLTTPGDVRNIMPRFSALREQQWTALRMEGRRAVVFGSQAYADFVSDVAEGFADLQALRCGVLQEAGEPIGIGLYFAASGRVLKYLEAWLPTAENPSPGLLLDWLMIRDAAQNGWRVFDFGRGGEEYKRRFGARAIPLLRWIVAPRSVRGLAALSSAMLGDRLQLARRSIIQRRQARQRLEVS